MFFCFTPNPLVLFFSINQYEQEDEMKGMVKELGVRDTLIDTDSEEEYESDEEEEEEEEETQQQQQKEPVKEEEEEEEGEVEESPQHSPPSASTRSKTLARHGRLAESKSQEKGNIDEEEKERGDARTDETCSRTKYTSDDYW